MSRSFKKKPEFKREYGSDRGWGGLEGRDGGGWYGYILIKFKKETEVEEKRRFVQRFWF